MSRFFAESGADGLAVLSKEDTLHVNRVLRLPVGARIEVVLDGQLFDAQVLKLDKRQAVVRLGAPIEADCEPKCRVTLYQALPKAAKMEFIIQKCVEIGVSKIVPVVSSRCVAKENAQKADRWQRIAREACKQCGRIQIPEIGAHMALADIPVERHQLFLFAYEKEARNGLKAMLVKHPDVLDVGVLVGPEGGFAAEEFSLLQRMGARTVTLGKRILRSETAGMAMLSAILYHYGDMDG